MLLNDLFDCEQLLTYLLTYLHNKPPLLLWPGGFIFHWFRRLSVVYINGNTIANVRLRCQPVNHPQLCPAD